MHNSVKFAEFDLHEPLASGLGSIERQLVFVVGTEKHDVIVGEDFELLLQIANAHGRFHGSHFEIPSVGRTPDGTPRGEPGVRLGTNFETLKENKAYGRIDSGASDSRHRNDVRTINHAANFRLIPANHDREPVRRCATDPWDWYGVTEGVLLSIADTYLAIQPFRFLSAFQFDSAARTPRKSIAVLACLPVGIGSAKPGGNSAFLWEVRFFHGHPVSRSRTPDGTPSLFRDNLEQTGRAVEGRLSQEMTPGLIS